MTRRSPITHSTIHNWTPQRITEPVCLFLESRPSIATNQCLSDQEGRDLLHILYLILAKALGHLRPIRAFPRLHNPSDDSPVRIYLVVKESFPSPNWTSPEIHGSQFPVRIQPIFYGTAFAAVSLDIQLIGPCSDTRM
jgi:hypothetical protein